MNIFGRPLSAYWRFVMPLCILIMLVGFTRLALSLNGMPDAQTKWISMTVVFFAGIAYLAVRMHTTGFGSYLQLLPAIVLTNICMQVVSIVGIVISIVTGHDNVFTAPEYSFSYGRSWVHVAAHIGIGIPVGSIVQWILGCLVLLVAKLLLKPRSN